MCGLVSVITKRRYGFQNDDKEAFTSLLFVDTLRGDDSTGAFVVDTTGNLKLAKEASQGPVFIQQKEYKELMQKAFRDGWCAVGHNRKATKGDINDKNAHPFVVDNNIVLVHNGTFYGDHKHHADTEVDSEALAHTIHKHNDDVEAALQTVNAAYALIWYNVKEKTLNLIRNSQRPLYWIETPDSWIWASEPSFLWFAATRHNIKITDGPHLLKENHLMQYKLQDDKSTVLEHRDVDVTYKPKVSQKGGAAADESLESAWWKSRLACGYDNLECEVTELHPLAHGMQEIGERPARSSVLLLPQNNGASKVHVLGLPWQRVQDKVIPEIKNDRDVRRVKFKHYMDIHARYKQNERLTIVVDNLFEADDNPKTENFIMCGHLATDPNVYGAFTFSEKDWNKLLEKTKDGVFHIDFKRATWTVDDNSGKLEHQEKEGICLIYGENPRYIDPIVFEGNVLQ